MKKILLFIIILISSAYAYSQTNFPDLAEKTTSSGAYEFAIYTGGAGYRMSVSTLQTDLYDSIADHRTELETLDTTDYFSRTGSLITLKDVGDDIRLGANEVLQFYDANNYIYSISSDSWIMVSGGSLTQVFGSDISIYKHFIPNTTNTIDLGSSSKFYRRAHLDTIYIENTSTSIHKDGSNNIVITDAVTGAKTLAVLAAPADSITTHRTELDNLSDSITTHRGELDNLADSIDIHRDTLTDHNTRMLALESSVVSTDSSWIYIETDSINELTAGHGVVIEGVEIKDGDVISTGVGSYDLGSSSKFWTNLFTGRHYITNMATYIEIDGGNIKFVDAQTGTRSLAQLAASADSITAHRTAIDNLNDSINTHRDTLTDHNTRLAVLETLTINAQTGTTYTLVLTDINKLITLSNAAADTLIVPPNASVAFPIGTQITITQLGAGQVLVEEGAAVTVSSAGSHLKLRVQYSSATLIKIDTNTWLLVGDIAS